jgi:DNA mismatch endonuclease, patch repair protein
MTDKLTAAQRSRQMARVRSKDTGPELTVRKLVHGLGYRFRLHRRDLPGAPDLVFPSRRKVIFVHGCFWHRHAACSRARTPQSNREYWLTKFSQNQFRDRRSVCLLRQAGWCSMVVWECELSDVTRLKRRIRSFLR